MFPGVRELLRQPAFRKLFVARTVSNFGNGLYPVAVAFGVLDLPGSTASTLSIVMAAQMLPMVIFMLFGGVIADRYPRAWLVGVTDQILGVFVVVNGIMLITGTATILSMSLIGAIGGTLNAIWWPAFTGIVPEIISDEQRLQQANAVIGFGSNVANILGAATAGIVVAFVGAGWAIAADGVTFLIAGFLVFMLRGFSKGRQTQEHSPTVFDDLVHGWREFSSRSWVWAPVLGYSLIVMCWEAAVSVVGPVHAKEVLGGPRPWSYIMAGLSAGMASGVVVSMRLKPKHPIAVGIAVQFSMALWLLIMGSSNWMPLLVVSAFLTGVTFDFFLVLWGTALQTHIPREALSRVSSYDAFGSLGLAPLGLVIAGPIVERYGAAHTFLGAGAIVAVVLCAILSVPGVRRLRSDTGLVA